MDFEIKITGKTDPTPGRFNNPEDFAVWLRQNFAQLLPAAYELKVGEPVEVSKGPVRALSDELLTTTLNDNVRGTCYYEDGVIRCKNLGNAWTKAIDGFPVDEQNGFHYLYDGMFNDVPEAFDSEAYRVYEDTILTPWLASMGFDVQSWGMGESDSFGPLTRVARLRRGRNRFIFVYG